MPTSRKNASGPFDEITDPGVIESLIRKAVNEQPECSVRSLNGKPLFTSPFVGVPEVDDVPYLAIRRPQATGATIFGSRIRIDFIHDTRFYRFLTTCRERGEDSQVLLLELPRTVSRRSRVRGAFRIGPSMREPVRVKWPDDPPWNPDAVPGGRKAHKQAIGDRLIDVSVSGVSFNTNLRPGELPPETIVEDIVLIPPPYHREVVCSIEIVHHRDNPGGAFTYRVGARFIHLQKESEHAISQYILRRQREEIRSERE